MYRFVPAVSGFRWTSLDREKGLKPNRISDLQHSVDFGGSPWKVDVERAMGIEPTPSAWEAEVLPLNYTRCMIPRRSCFNQAGDFGIIRIKYVSCKAD